MMVSRKVFCGATCPLRTGILGVPRRVRSSGWPSRHSQHSFRALENFIRRACGNAEPCAYPNNTFPNSNCVLFASRNPSDVVSWTHLLRDMWDAELGVCAWSSITSFQHRRVLGYPFVQLKLFSSFIRRRNRGTSKNRDAYCRSARSSRFDGDQQQLTLT